MIQLPGQPPVEHVLREETTTLGRAARNTIALSDSSVSLAHATISRVGADYIVRDLQSTNGTSLNGQSVSEARLRHGDQIKFGEAAAIFRLGPAGATSPAFVVSNLSPDSSVAPAKSDTTILSAKSKTTRLRPMVASPASSPPVPPKRRSAVPVLSSVLGGVAAAVVVALLAWKLADVGTNKPATNPSPNTISPPVQTQASASNQTTPVASALEAEIALTNQETVSAFEETSAPIQPEPLDVSPTLAALKSPDAATRRRAGQEICALGSAATNALLNVRVALLQDTDPEARLWLVIALAQQNVFDPPALPVLLDGLKLENPALRQRACTTLALVPYDDAGLAAAVAALKTAAQDENEGVRQAARATLQSIAPGAAAGN